MYGLSLGARLKAYFKVFAQRPDICVYGNWRSSKHGHIPLKNAFGKSLSLKKAESLHKKQELPIDIIAFGLECGSFSFEWDFSDRTGADTNMERGANGGSFRYMGIDSSWNSKPTCDSDFYYKEFVLIDNFTEEAIGILAYENSKNDAKMLFIDYNENDCYELGNFEEYIRLGAKYAFCPYWQNHNIQINIFEELKHNSIPSKTPDNEILKLLQQKNISIEEAKSLLNWLKEDVTILLAK